MLVSQKISSKGLEQEEDLNGKPIMKARRRKFNAIRSTSEKLKEINDEQ